MCRIGILVWNLKLIFLGGDEKFYVIVEGSNFTKKRTMEHISEMSLKSKLAKSENFNGLILSILSIILKYIKYIRAMEVKILIFVCFHYIISKA